MVKQSAGMGVAGLPGAPHISFRLRVRQSDRIAVGPGKIALLEAIEATGSLSAAARTLDMSYRRAWLLLDELNACLRSPAIISVQGGAAGGGSRLTDAGRRLVATYRRIERTAEAACSDDLQDLVAMLGD